MSRWKKILTAAVLSIVVLIVAIYAFLSLYDFNKFKPMLARTVKNATGRELTIAGNIEFDLGIRPTLIVEDVSLQNASWSSSPQLANVKRMEIQIAALPLIIGKFDFVRLVLIEPHIIVEFDSKGTSNFSFDTNGEEIDESKTAPPPFMFSDLLIENGKFAYRDEQSDFNFSVIIDRLTAEIPGFTKPLQLVFKGAYNDIPLNLNGSLGPIWAWIEPGYSMPADLTVAAGGATANVKGEIRDPTHFKDLSFSIAAEGASTTAVAKLAGTPDIPDFGTFKLAATVRDPQGQMGIEGLDVTIGSEALIAVSVSGDIKDLLNLQGIQLNVNARGNETANLTRLGLPTFPRRGAFNVTADVSNPQVNLYSVSNLNIVLGTNEIKGQVTLNLTEQVPFLTAALSSPKFEIGPAVLDLHLIDPFDKPAIKNIDLNLGSPDLAAIQIKGAVEDLLELQGVDINFEAHGQDLTNLKQLTGQSLPVRGSFSAAGKVLIPVHKNLKIPDLKITAGKNTITGSLNLDLRGKQPQLEAKFSSPQLDLPSVLLPVLSRQGWVKGLGQIRPVKLAVKLTGLPRELAVKNIDLQAGTLDSAEVRLSGSVENIVTRRGLDLNFSLRGKEQSKLKEILAQPYLFAPVPGQGAYSVSGNISASTADTYEVKDFKFTLASNELTGRLNFNLAAQAPEYEVELTAPKFNLKPFPIPKESVYNSLNQIDDLGPLKIHSKVIVRGNHLSLPLIELHAGTEKLAALDVKGSIKNLTSQSGIDLNFYLRGNEIANLSKITSQSLPLQGAYAISGKLADPGPKNYQVGELILKLGENEINGSLDLNFSASPFRLAADLMSPKFTLQPVTLPALETLSQIDDLGPLKLTFNLAGTSNKLTLDNLALIVGREEIIMLLLKGTISDLSAIQGMNLTFSIKGKDISKVVTAGGREMPSKGTFQVSGQISDPTPKFYKLNAFDVVWGDSQSSGRLELDVSGQRPKLTAELSSDKLDLRPFLGHPQNRGEAETQTAKTVALKKEKTKTPPSKPVSPKARVFPAKPLPLAELQRIDADVKFRGKQVLLRTLALNDVAVDTLLLGGNLDIKPFKFTIGGGKAEGWINLKSRKRPAELMTNLTIDQFTIGPMLDQLDYPHSIEGNIDAVVDLDGTGDSVAALMAGLNGHIRIAVKDGKAESKYLDLLGKYFGSGILRMINPFEAKRQYAPINCFVNTVIIDDGKADIKLLLDTDQTSIFGAGSINLKTERLDLGIKPTPKKGALPADISFNLKKLSQPFRLGGTLANPSLAIDPGRTAFVMGKFAGALALGPIGIAAFFADVSIGKKDTCAVALEAAEKRIQPAGANNVEKSSKKTGTEDEKKEKKESGGFFKRLFEK